MYEANGGLFVRLSEVAGWSVNTADEEGIWLEHTCGHSVTVKPGPEEMVANVIVAILNDSHECPKAAN